jgi:hypothetical protein
MPVYVRKKVWVCIVKIGFLLYKKNSYFTKFFFCVILRYDFKIYCAWKYAVSHSTD